MNSHPPGVSNPTCESDLKRVAIIQTRLAPFRVEFFGRLARSHGIHLTVFHCENKNASSKTSCSHAPYFSIVPLKTTFLGGRASLQHGLLSALKNNKIDVIVAEARLGLLVNPAVLLHARRYGRRFLWWTCGWERSELEAITSLKRVVRGWLFRAADGGIAYSNIARSYMTKLGMNPDKVWVAQNSIDTDVLLEIERKICEDVSILSRLRTQFDATGRFLVLFVGKLVNTKRVDLLIRAFAEAHRAAPDSALWIVGDGPEKTYLEKLATEHPGLPIRFLGEITEPVKINAIYMACDVFALPGTGGLAINQAMTFGRPIVVSRADGTEEDLVTDKVNGLYFRPGSAHDLAEKILALHNDAALRRKMGEASRDRILNSINMKNMVGAFRDAIFNRPQVPS